MMTPALARLLRVLVHGTLPLLIWAGSATAQTRTEEALVTQIAGSDVYLSVAGTSGLSAEDLVSAYDLETGEQLWRFYSEGPVRFAPVVFKDRVLFGSDDQLSRASGGGPQGIQLVPVQ